MADSKPPKKKTEAWRKKEIAREKAAAALAAAPKKPRRSKLAKFNPIVDMTAWRREMQTAKIKFDDEAKGVFLEHFAKTSLKKRSAEAAGVHIVTINAHLEVDPDFAMAYNEALASYRDTFVELGVHQLAYKGISIKAVNQVTGEVYEVKREHAIPIVSLELKRVDPAFRDKHDVTVGITGGVLVVQADVTPEDWVEDQRVKNQSRTNPMLDDPFHKQGKANGNGNGKTDVKPAEVTEVKLRNRAEEVAERNGNGKAKKAGRTVVAG